MTSLERLHGCRQREPAGTAVEVAAGEGVGVVLTEPRHLLRLALRFELARIFLAIRLSPDGQRGEPLGKPAPVIELDHPHRSLLRCSYEPGRLTDSMTKSVSLATSSASSMSSA